MRVPSSRLSPVQKNLSFDLDGYIEIKYRQYSKIYLDAAFQPAYLPEKRPFSGKLGASLDYDHGHSKTHMATKPQIYLSSKRKKNP
jgi:hypothetical protein